MKKFFLFLFIASGLFAQGSGWAKKDTIKFYFMTGKKPTQAQFYSWINTTASVHNSIGEANERLYGLDSAFRFVNPAGTFSYILKTSPITADRLLKLPLITGTDTLVTLNMANTWVGTQTFGNFTSTGTATLAKVNASKAATLDTARVGNFYAKSGSDLPVQNVTLVGGTITQSNSIIVSGAYLLITKKTNGGTPGTYTYTVTDGQYTITSSSGTDTSTLTVFIINPY